MSEWVSAGKVRMTTKGIHDSNISYKILDLVSNSGKSAFYIAKQDVPAGTALTNTEYWENILNTGEVTSVAGKTGAVTLDADDVSYDATSQYEEGTVGHEFANVQERVDEIESSALSAYSTDTASGSVVQFDDGADNIPVKSLVVDIASTAGVTGATITRAGKNLLPMASLPSDPVRGVTFTRNSDGTISYSGTTTSSDLQTEIGSATLPAGSYILTGAVDSVARLRLTLNGTLKGHDTGNGYSFTLETPAVVAVQARISTTTGTEVSGTFSPMIRLTSNTDATYEPCGADTYAVTFPSGAGTVTAGTLDVTGGTLTVNSNTYPVTPLEIDTLLGVNTIFADCGNVTVTYHADPELFLDSNYVKKNDYNDTIEDLNDKDDQVGAKLLALLKKNMTDTTENGYLINSMCSYMGFKDILYFYNHKTVDVNTGEIKQASEEIPGSVPPMYQIKGATDYIDIGTQLTFKVSANLPYNYYCYDMSKQYLGRATVNNAQSAYDEIECLTNTKYIRLSFYLPSLDQDQLLRSVQGALVVINNQKYCYIETAYGE